MERPPSSGQDYGMTSLEWTKIMERPTSSGPWMMEGQTSTGPRLWNTLPRVDQDYGTPSLQWTKIMEYHPSSGPRFGTPFLE